MTSPAFTVVKNIPIPPRTIPNAGPRGSMYPVDDMEEGECFAVSVDSPKQARQKQSQFSGLAKSRGIRLVTRFYSGEDGNDSPFEDTPAPCLGVWHGGEAEAKPAKDDANADADAGEASDASDEGEDDEFTL